MPEGTPTVRGYDFEGALDLQAMLDTMLTSGFQATQLGRAVNEVNRMIRWRLADEPIEDDEKEEEKDPAFRAACRRTTSEDSQPHYLQALPLVRLAGM
jgi:deoxyhypusine synthase